MTTTTAKFETGKTYYVHSTCDYDCIFTFTVIKRTAKTVTLKNGQGEVTRRNIADGGESECCYPLGKFSLCPCLYANKVYDEPANKINNTDELNDDETTADATNATIAAEFDAIKEATEIESNYVKEMCELLTARADVTTLETARANYYQAHNAARKNMYDKFREVKTITGDNTSEEYQSEHDTLMTEYHDTNSKAIEASKAAFRAVLLQALITKFDQEADVDETKTTTTTEQEENTMTTQENYLAAKEVISVRHNFDNDRDEWYINGKRTNKKNAVAMLKNYNLTLDTFKAEHEAYINEQIAKGARQMAIDDQAEHFRDKISREVKACDDNDNVFSHLPELDELNDVENFDDELILSTCVVDEKIYFTPIGNEFCNITVADEYVHFFNGKLFLIRSPKYHARWKDGYFFAILGDIVKPFDSDEEFFAEMAKRGACTIDEQETPVDTDKPIDDFGTKLAELQAKRDAAQAALLKAQDEHATAENTLQKLLSDTAANLTTKLQDIKFDYRIKLIKNSCWTFSITNFDDVYIRAYRVGCGVEFHVETWIGKTLARYDTPAQVDKVIDMLRAAIERGDKEFKFPTVDELTTTRKAA